MRDLPHPFWAKYGETEKGHITAVRNDLPGIAAHTAAGGPKRAHGSVTSTGFDLRTRIPLARSARFQRRAAARKNAPQHNSVRPRPGRGRQLLDLDLGAGLFELLLDRSGFVLVDAFLDGLRSAIHQVLGFFEAQAGDFADRFNDVDLVAANVREHDGEFRLLFRRCRAACRRPAACRHNRSRSRGDAEGFFHLLYQVGRFEQRQPLDFFQDRFDFRHDSFFSSQFLKLNLLGRFGSRFSSWCCTGPAGPKLVGFNGFADGHRKVTRQSVQGHGDALRRSVQQEHDLADQLLLRREVRELLNLRDRNDAALDHAGLELKRRDVFGNLGERLGQRDRVGRGVGDRIRSAQVLEQVLGGGTRAGTLRERVLYDLVLAARGLHGAAELGVVLDRDALKGRENDRRYFRKLGLELVEVLLFFAAILHKFAPLAWPLNYAAAAIASTSARSIVMPGPMVEVMVIFLTYLPLAAAGLAFTTASITARAFSASFAPSN